MRVALIINPQTWSGGISYFRNLMAAVDRLPDPVIQLIIFTSAGNDSAVSVQTPGTIVRTHVLDRNTPLWLFRKLASKLLGADWLLHHILTQNSIDVISHGGPLVPNSPIASVGWIPDFQHLHLPDFFTERERRARDREFMQLCARCDGLIVSSECAMSDLRSFAPQYAAKATVLHFVAASGARSGAPSLPELQRRYGFDGAYLLLPNQFWIHKNHRVVIDALTLLKQREKRIVVLATGATRDDRQPAFFDSFLQYARNCDVLDRFRVLGVIPLDDLFGLMQHAVALINPSLFEGWSTSVEESKSLGKRILLSDIPVHREQAPALGLYFKPDDAEGLAQLMQQVTVAFDPELDLRNQHSARAALPLRQIQYARTYQQILLSASPI